MKAASILSIFFLMLSVVAPSALFAGTGEFDRAMGPILAEYLKIHRALVADQTEGVREAAEKIGVLADSVDPKTVNGEHAMHYSGVPMDIKKAALQLGQQEEIAAMREAFKELSRPMAMWATMSKPKGIYIVYCSMAKGSWLQNDKVVQNPYHGPAMLRCGEIVGGAEDDTGGRQHPTTDH